MENTSGNDQQMVSEVESKMVSEVESKMEDKPVLSEAEGFNPEQSTESEPSEVMIEATESDGILPTETVSPVEPMTESLMTEPSANKSLWKKPWFVVLMSIIAFILIVGIWLAIAAQITYGYVQSTSSHAQATMDAFEARDLALAKTELASTKSALADTKKSWGITAPLRLIPGLGLYLRDINHTIVAGEKGTEVGDLVISAIEPYADIMGFSGTGSEDVQLGTAEERIIFVASTVEKLAPQMDEISAKLKEMSDEFQAINEKRYPKTIAGKEVRENITTLKSTVAGAAESLSQFQPIIKILPDLLGNPDPKKYLIVFQNDAELRPTGGFLTAYATMTITKGKIEPGISEDIYTLDAGFKKKIPAPEPILKYLPLVYNWNLRDMNLSPDFKDSMDTFTTHMKDSSAAPEFDALVAIDTAVPVAILKVLGPIGVGGYGGKFSAENDPRCDCPQVIYELENIITRPTYEIREGRKSILGPLMNSMLANMMGSPKAKWAEFFNIFSESIKEKHLLMYFKDPERQEAVEALGAAGRINDYVGDYLHISDTNFAGAKSNMFVTQEVEQNATVGADGSVTRKLILTYKNPRPGDNCNLEAGQLCLNGLLRHWQRIYVPKGSVLKSAKGYELDMATTEDLGKTVFEGFYTLSPQSVKKLEIEYTVPAGTITGDEYKLLVQKQPGTRDIKTTMTVGSAKSKVYTLDSDQEIILPR